MQNGFVFIDAYKIERLHVWCAINPNLNFLHLSSYNLMRNRILRRVEIDFFYATEFSSKKMNFYPLLIFGLHCLMKNEYAATSIMK